MKKGYLKLSLLMCLVVQLFTVQAQAQNVHQQLLDASGSSASLTSIPDSMKAGFVQAAQSTPGFNQDMLTFLTNSIDQHFSVANLQQNLNDYVGKRISADEAKALLNWYNSALGKEIVAAEKSAGTPQAIESIQQQAQQLFSDQMRVAFAQKMDETLGLTNMMLDMQVGTAVAIAQGMTSLTQPQLAQDSAAMRQHVAQSMEPMRDNMKTMITVMMVYAYKDIGEDKLKAYGDFLSTPACQKFAKVLLQGTRIAMETESQRWATSIAQQVSAMTKNNSVE